MRSYFSLLKIVVLSLVLLPFNDAHSQGLEAFPGAEGFGRYTTGGRGGDVYHVTTLEDCPNDKLVEGTLRYGCRNASNSTIVFDVSGTIHLTSELALTATNVTIAGQTAPGDGICIADYPFTISANNVILRYLRFRLGDVNVAHHEGDGLGGMDRTNVIVDHCSISWSVDECCSVYGIKNLTVQWSVIAQSMRDSGHEKGAHGYGGNWGGQGATYHHNLLCHHESRTPRLGPRQGTQTKELLDMRNNVFYNWAGNGCYGGEGMNVNIVNNFYKPGPATKKKGGAVAYRIASIGVRTTAYCTLSVNDNDTIWNGWKVMRHKWGKYFVDGNVIDGNAEVTKDNWTKGIYAQTTNGANVDYKWTQKTMDTIRLNEAIPFYQVTTHTAENAYNNVLDYAGASLHRDSFDEQMVYDTRNGVASYGTANNLPGLVNSQNDNKPSGAGSDWSAWPTLNSTAKLQDSDNDGMPDEWELANGLNPFDASDRNKLDSEGYTMLEVYINGLVEEITDAQNKNGSLSGYEPDENEGKEVVLINAGWNPSSNLVSVTSTGGMSQKGEAAVAAAVTAFDISGIVGSEKPVTLGEYFDVMSSYPCKFENNTYTITARTGYALTEIHSIGYTAGDAKPTFTNVLRQIDSAWETKTEVEVPTSTNPNLSSASTTKPNLSSIVLKSDKGYVNAISITRGGRENACNFILILEKVETTSVSDGKMEMHGIRVDGFNVIAENARRILVYSINGVLVGETNESVISIEGMPKGIYVVKAVCDNGQQVVSKVAR